MSNDNIDRWFVRTQNEDNARHASVVSSMQKQAQPRYIPLTVVGAKFDTRAVLSLHRTHGSKTTFSLDIGSTVMVDEESGYGGETYYSGTTSTGPTKRDVFVIKKTEFEELLNDGSLVRF